MDDPTHPIVDVLLEIRLRHPRDTSKGSRAGLKHRCSSTSAPLGAHSEAAFCSTLASGAGPVPGDPPRSTSKIGLQSDSETHASAGPPGLNVPTSPRDRAEPEGVSACSCLPCPPCTLENSKRGMPHAIAAAAPNLGTNFSLKASLGAAALFTDLAGAKGTGRGHQISRPHGVTHLPERPSRQPAHPRVWTNIGATGAV